MELNVTMTARYSGPLEGVKDWLDSVEEAKGALELYGSVSLADEDVEPAAPKTRANSTGRRKQAGALTDRMKILLVALNDASGPRHFKQLAERCYELGYRARKTPNGAPRARAVKEMTHSINVACSELVNMGYAERTGPGYYQINAAGRAVVGDTELSVAQAAAKEPDKSLKEQVYDHVIEGMTSPNEIRSALRARYKPLGRDIGMNSVTAALSNLKTEGRVKRVGYGKYEPK